MNSAIKTICILLGSMASLHSSQNWQNKILAGTSFDQILIVVPPHTRKTPFCLQELLVSDDFSSADLLALHQDHKAKGLPNNHVVMLARVGVDSGDNAGEILSNRAVVANNFIGHFGAAEEPAYVARFKANLMAALVHPKTS